MRGYNHVILIGNCGKDPELKQLEDGTSVAKLTLATSNSFRSSKGVVQHTTDWHSIILWRGLAELVGKYVVKGSLLMIEGQLKTRSYTAKEGHTVYVTEVVADKLILLDKKPASEPYEEEDPIPPF